MIFYASDSKQGWYTELVVMVQNGKAESTCITRNPTLIFLSHNGMSPQVAIYAERGDKITIEGNSAEPVDWKIGGNKINEQWSEWRAQNRAALSSGSPVEINKAVEQYVVKNNENPLSTLLLLLNYDRNEDPTGFQKLWKKLDGEALEQKWTDLVSRNDMIDGTPKFGDNVASMILRTAGSGCDTVSFKGRGALLLFRSDSYDSTPLDSLRALTREFRDSSTRIIADIALLPDSASWRSGIASDSIRNVIRAWNPLGVTDSVISRLGVTQTPMWVVVGRRGEKLYIGTDPTKAATAFRKLQKK